MEKGKERRKAARRKEASAMMVDAYLRGGGGGGSGSSARGWRERDDAAVHHRQRREVFVQNGEGWLNCYRSSSHANIVYLAANARPRSFRILSTPSVLPPSLAVDTLREYALSV